MRRITAPKIRKARLSDRYAISQLTKKFPDTLSCSPREITQIVGNFWVVKNAGGQIIGCCNFKLWRENAEIIS